MQEAFEKIREKLEDQIDNNRGWEDEPWFAGNTEGYEYAIEIVNQVEEEYQAKSEDVSNKLLSGEWVDTDDIKKYLGIGFSLGMKLFDFSRKAEWNPPPLNGQKITTEFRLKRKNNNGWIPVEERLPRNDCYCLITTSDGEIDVREYGYSKGWGWDGFERIIAWQPLPEPYQKGE
jgi:hypothetical protein